MTDTLKIALAQLNPVVGDIGGNLALAREARAEAGAMDADLVVFTELFITGYPPEDLILKPAFQDDAEAAVRALAGDTATGGPAIAIGTPWREHGQLHNSLAVLHDGEVRGVRHKYELPNYSVFDEKRVFQSGPLPGPVNFNGVRLGFMICEDMWTSEVTECLQETGAEILIVPNGSPYHVEKEDIRLNVVVARVSESKLPVIYVNQVGGQDELVFDGGSFVLNPDASLAHQMPQWEPGLRLTTWSRENGKWVSDVGDRAAAPEQTGNVYNAMVLGLRDYVRKNGFPGVVLGLSGGIDSALSAAIAVDALGPERVHCVMMPYRYTSSDSLADAEACAKALGVRYDIIPIGPAVEGFAEMLQPLFDALPADTTEENVQARARGITLMAISNKLGSMVLSTGNKSEVSVGYSTLYGDMVGGFNVLKDAYKMTVYRLSQWRNQHLPKGALGPGTRVIPENIISKPPSAELRPDQTDQDSLPDYEVLDGILHCLVEDEMAYEEIVARGYDGATVKRVEHLLYVAEYKRRQAAPGVKITPKMFGRDRRYPIVNRFRDAR